ncbi:MAG: hypothetical protein ACJA08_000480 [Cyclobacteriaceae bacterium]|jgi:hypothetical protein
MTGSFLYVRLCYLVAAVICLFSCQEVTVISYYVDCESGSDLNEGTSAAEAWQSLERVNQVTFEPGDKLLFKAGCEWSGTLLPKGSGAPNKPITMGKYGEGKAPKIQGQGAYNCTPEAEDEHFCTLFLYNQEYWAIRDLEITNYDQQEEGITLTKWEQHNIDSFANYYHPKQYQQPRKRKSAILVQARNYGAIHNLTYNNLYIHGINGDIRTKNNGGIFLEILGSESEKPTYFDGLVFDSCYIHDVDRTGISNSSYYENRTLDSIDNWTPSLGYIVRNCRFERTGANALILRVADKPIIENNLFDHCAIKESGNAFFVFNTDSALLQYNEGRFTKYNIGDHDAGGIDSDFRTKWTIMQYNYIHDNDFGPLVTGGQRSFGGFNEGTIVRFNIFENDGITRDTSDGRLDYSFKISGNATNTWVHNNIFKIGSKQKGRAAVYHKNWGGYPSKSTYYNNVIINDGVGTYLQMTESTENHFENNVIANKPVRSWPSRDANIVDVRELFKSDNDGYVPSENSLLRNTGIELIKMPTKDYEGKRIHADSLNIGINF